MLRQDQIAKIVDSQKEDFLSNNPAIVRENMDKVADLETFATLVTGIRRCGKSTMLRQIILQKYPDSFFLNFEDIRLAGFEISDFSRLYDEIKKRDIKVRDYSEKQKIQ
jgi:predicted AAA+ superfamily ATPase